jgi:hypothetical protein
MTKITRVEQRRTCVADNLTCCLERGSCMVRHISCFHAGRHRTIKRFLWINTYNVYQFIVVDWLSGDADFSVHLIFYFVCNTYKLDTLINAAEVKLFNKLVFVECTIKCSREPSCQSAAPVALHENLACRKLRVISTINKSQR